MLLLTNLDGNIVACSRRLQTWYLGTTQPTGTPAHTLADPPDRQLLATTIEQLASGHQRNAALHVKVRDIRGQRTEHHLHVVRIDTLLAWHLTWIPPPADVIASAAIWISPQLDNTTWHHAPAAIGATAGHLLATFPEHPVTFDNASAYIIFDDAPTREQFDERIACATQPRPSEAQIVGDLCGIHITSTGTVTARIEHLAPPTCNSTTRKT
jgi:hypothetical protein